MGHVVALGASGGRSRPPRTRQNPLARLRCSGATRYSRHPFHPRRPFRRGRANRGAGWSRSRTTPPGGRPRRPARRRLRRGGAPALGRRGPCSSSPTIPRKTRAIRRASPSARGRPRGTGVPLLGRRARLSGVSRGLPGVLDARAVGPTGDAARTRGGDGGAPRRRAACVFDGVAPGWQAGLRSTGDGRPSALARPARGAELRVVRDGRLVHWLRTPPGRDDARGDDGPPCLAGTYRVEARIGGAPVDFHQPLRIE